MTTEADAPTPEEIIASPGCSAWLRASLMAALARDPVDAADDAELMAQVLASRAEAILAADAARLGLRGKP